ncbi:KilA-N domain-containing protein [Dyadobacter sp. CY345]|uniref:KilA-N domain-containing protein n=1 Tax=Dyadobacter sp. CY345 TaxID=2909335 RepID=UPI001F24C10B|nr:KilA-N domain-containing protein [Dyadobacter sp. CY345]MCF2445300.1 KilA-N domain-containing protein [Dyadobacter sp. CY345]
MSKYNKITVQDIEIGITTVNNEDFISLTDMIRAKDGDFFVSDWLRNRNTLEYIGAWEAMHNPDFNYGEFAIIKDKSGLNNFKMSVKEWCEKTGSIGITAKTGRYGGTYAHKDIAFNFGMWISPVFQLHIVKEYQRLKELESNEYNLEWNVKRILSKTNYRLHTDAVKDYILPKAEYSKAKEWILYADEADLLNIALWGCTAKDWKQANTQRALNGENIRDMASINDLAVLSNIENLNSVFIAQGMSKTDRLRLLAEIAKKQRLALDGLDIIKGLKKLDKPRILTLKILINNIQ